MKIGDILAPKLGNAELCFEPDVRYEVNDIICDHVGMTNLKTGEVSYMDIEDIWEYYRIERK